MKIILRSPIDSAIRHGDVLGLYDHCVTVQLVSGQVVEQNMVPGVTHCHPVFLQEWTRLMAIRWRKVILTLDSHKHFFDCRRYQSAAAQKIFVIMKCHQNCLKPGLHISCSSSFWELFLFVLS